MPYIERERRGLLAPSPAGRALTTGELNFQVTNLLDRFINLDGVSYARINAAIGVLECAKLELYRRIAAPYEDGKLAENGEVYRCAP